MQENKQQNTGEKIDIVITWVDGSDEKWLSERNTYLPEGKRVPISHEVADSSDVRYRDWGFLPFLLAGIRKFALWSGNIFLVTAGQTPEGFDIWGKDVKLVFHKDFIPAEYLPTFSSRTIEWHLHKIPGLSEKFVYFNDDTLIIAPTTEEDFFKNGLPCDMHVQNVIAPISETMPPVQTNNMKIVNKYCSKQEFMKKHRDKWCCPCYGKNLFRNYLLKPWNYFTGFYDPHLPLSLTKKMIADLWKTEFHAVHNTCTHKFKQTDDVNIWLCRYLYLARGEFTPRAASFGKYTEISNDNSALVKSLLSQKYKVICLNDSKACTNFPVQKEIILSALGEILPLDSSPASARH